MRNTFLICALYALTRLAVAAPPAFTVSPTASGDGRSARFSFSVNQETDVEVAVVNATGHVVRHLAAGVLGKNAPEPLKKDSLAQALVWDGRDDAGKPAVGGPFKFRVRLGLKPAFSHVFAGDPAKHMGVVSMACGAGGELYVQSMSWAPSSHYVLMDVKAYDAKGAFLRQVAPYPAMLPPEKRSAVKWLDMPDGPAVPLIYHASAKCLYPEMGDGGRNMLVRPDVRNNVSVGVIPLSNTTKLDEAGNLLFKTVDEAGFADPAKYDLSLKAGSRCIDKAVESGKVGEFSLRPDLQYAHPHDKQKRPDDGKLDVGAFEFKP